VGLAKELQALTADILPALEELPVIAYLLDAEGRVRWESETAIAVFGDLRGRMPDVVVAPEDLNRTQEERVQKLLGLKPTSDFEAHLVLIDGSVKRVEVSSVALRDGKRVVGIFGIVHGLRLSGCEARSETSALTPRQHEVLELLADGLSTRQIAEQLSLSVETVRNHVRGILAALGAHSRLEALALARRRHLI